MPPNVHRCPLRCEGGRVTTPSTLAPRSFPTDSCGARMSFRPTRTGTGAYAFGYVKNVFDTLIDITDGAKEKEPRKAQATRLTAFSIDVCCTCQEAGAKYGESSICTKSKSLARAFYIRLVSALLPLVALHCLTIPRVHPTFLYTTVAHGSRIATEYMIKARGVRHSGGGKSLVYSGTFQQIHCATTHKNTDNTDE